MYRSSIYSVTPPSKKKRPNDYFIGASPCFTLVGCWDARGREFGMIFRFGNGFAHPSTNLSFSIPSDGGSERSLYSFHDVDYYFMLIPMTIRTLDRNSLSTCRHISHINQSERLVTVKRRLASCGQWSQTN